MQDKDTIFIEDSEIASALLELSFFIRELGKDKAYTLNTYLKKTRRFSPPVISENLWLYIKSRSRSDLIQDVKRVIIKNFRDGIFHSDKLNEDWFIIKFRGFCYYHFERESFYNVFSIPKKNLPLFVNYNFDEQDKIAYLNRLRGVLP